MREPEVLEERVADVQEAVEGGATSGGHPCLMPGSRAVVARRRRKAIDTGSCAERASSNVSTPGGDRAFVAAESAHLWCLSGRWTSAVVQPSNPTRSMKRAVSAMSPSRVWMGPPVSKALCNMASTRIRSSGRLIPTDGWACPSSTLPTIRRSSRSDRKPESSARAILNMTHEFNSLDVSVKVDAFSAAPQS